MRVIFNRIKKECFEIKLNARISDDEETEKLNVDVFVWLHFQGVLWRVFSHSTDSYSVRKPFYLDL